jgi:hypothetical protein
VYGLEAKTKRKFKRLHAIIIVAVLLTAALGFAVYTLTSNQTGPGPVKIEVEAGQPSYLQGELVQFYVYVNNTQNWPVIQPSTVTYQMGTDSQTACIDYVNPPPTFAPHSRTLLQIHTWNQKTASNGTQTAVEPGNYT